MSDAATPKINSPELGPAFPRTHHVLWLEFGNREDFDDPRKEWRRLFSELLGTFALVLVAAGGGLLHAKGQVSLAAAVVAPGLMVMAIILFMGAVSGAHLNPAVSLAFALRGDFPWRRVPGYMLIQLIGATLACLFVRLVFGNIEHLGATLPGPGYKDWQALLMEIVLTALLVSVILGTASAAQNVGAIAALGVGGYIALAGLWAAPVSGVSMNPARSFGPALVSGDWTSYWVYVVGPLAGALIAVGCALVLRGRGGDAISRAAGSGVLDEGPSPRLRTGTMTRLQTRRVAMAETTSFTIGADASCTDGVCGEVTRVIVDPVARAVTHLAVEPKHRHGSARLVPLDLVDATTGEIRLRCTLAEFEKLGPAEETQLLPGTPGYPGYDPEQVLFMPYYGMGMGMGMAGAYAPLTVTYDAIPLDEVEVRRGEHVHATDGHIGRVQGLVIDPNNHHVTHVLLQEGHLWGRKEVAIPIGAVIGVDDGIRLNITKQQVQDLPPVDIHHPGG